MNKFLNFSKLHLFEEKPNSFFIKDAIHEEIDFSEDQFWLYELINTKELQRLFNLKQLSLTWWNFPSSTHTRFCHSIGVYELCNRFIKHFLLKGDLDVERDKFQINIALAYSLLHDIGHGPLSHAFERAIPGFHHEKMGCKIISSPETKVNYLLRKKALEDGLEDGFYVSELSKLFNKNSGYKWIEDLVSSDVDVDRLDFLVRDSYYSGVFYGKAINISFLIKWSTLKKNSSGERRLAFHIKAENQLEQFLFARKKMYSDLYCNRVTQVYESILGKIFEFIIKNIEKFKNLNSFRDIDFLFSKDWNDWTIEEFLGLYDWNFLNCLEQSLEMGPEESRKYSGYIFGNFNKLNMVSCIEEMGISSFLKIAKNSEKAKVRLWDPNSKTLIEKDIIG